MRASCWLGINQPSLKLFRIIHIELCATTPNRNFVLFPLTDALMIGYCWNHIYLKVRRPAGPLSPSEGCVWLTTEN
ncbi:hypothetical protein BRADI_3g61056v3 [Brachypodium distachyon]|uniref:Uncharacterized protein n=1 Tax=Brachypodium distachyon TaxID=15368 RepID=A0A2K2D671_BRADI|nr:hypothetical protein BRADI_3g61056v3 [Brachypodium distachyon]